MASSMLPEWRTSVLCFLAAGGLAMMGCSAKHHTSFRHRDLEGGTVSITAIDAKQRTILRAKSESDGEAVERFCAEPSPDVFSVVAQALSAGGALTKSADPKALEASLKAAFSSAEQGSTIPRTQTVNLLRELMYRTCERYLSGGYTPLELSVQAVRDQRLIVSILAIEQLTGAITPKPVVVGAAGSAGGGEDAIVRIDDAKKASEEAAAAETKAKKALDDENGDKSCDAIAAAVKKNETLSEEQKAKQAKCEEKSKALLEAKSAASSARGHYDSLRKLAEASGISASTTLTSVAPGGLDRASAESVKEVANIVKEIVKESFVNDTEVMLFCIKALVDPKTQETLGARYAQLADSCLGYVQERVKSEELRIASEAGASREIMKTVGKELFVTYWSKVSGLTEAERRKKILADLQSSTLTPTERPEANKCFNAATKEVEYQACFAKLRSAIQRDLAGGK
jgi:uncharacterized protein (DUF1697 family)